jgi:hemolysin activation/secretion protein
MKKFEFQLGFALLVSFISTAQAQYVPDAGSLMRQTEQMLRQEQLQRQQLKREVLPPAMVINSDTRITVERFQFKGNKLLKADQLQAVAAPFSNRPLNQHDLQQLTHAIAEAYRQTGWIVQAYIPSQDLKNGEMTVQVVETIPPNKP